MKKLMYLFVAGTIFAFTACSGGANEEAATEEAVEVAVCANTGEPCLADHSCCATSDEDAAACCCGDETCDGSCHDDEADAHEGHDHEGHDHEGHDHEGHDHE